tara:strand:+ start:786 stop:2405 length:1620 start_codon:yes stop_codon:yes gene_type:complete
MPQEDDDYFGAAQPVADAIGTAIGEVFDIGDPNDAGLDEHIVTAAKGFLNFLRGDAGKSDGSHDPLNLNAGNVAPKYLGRGDWQLGGDYINPQWMNQYGWYQGQQVSPHFTPVNVQNPNTDPEIANLARTGMRFPDAVYGPSATDPFIMGRGNQGVTPEELAEYSDIAKFISMFDGPATDIGDYERSPEPDAPFEFDFGGSSQPYYDIGAMWGNLFDQQREAANEKLNTVTNYLNELQGDRKAYFDGRVEEVAAKRAERGARRDERFATWLQDIDQRREASEQRAADMGIDTIYGSDFLANETKAMLQVSQMSGADMLNVVDSVIDESIDFAETESDLSIRNALVQASLTHEEELATINQAELAQEISTAQAANAAAVANQKAKTKMASMAQIISMMPDVSPQMAQFIVMADDAFGTDMGATFLNNYMFPEEEDVETTVEMDLFDTGTKQPYSKEEMEILKLARDVLKPYQMQQPEDPTDFWVEFGPEWDISGLSGKYIAANPEQVDLFIEQGVIPPMSGWGTDFATNYAALSGFSTAE